MTDEYGYADAFEHGDGGQRPARPPFFHRLWMVFVQPGDLFKGLAPNPAWFPMAVFVGAVMAASTLLAPAEMYQDMALQGVDGEANAEAAENIGQLPPIVFRVGALAAALVFGGFIVPVLISVGTYVLFVFIRGDEATFKQHLCVVVHSGVVVAVGGILNTFVAVRAGDLTQALTVGSFFPFLPEGFFSNFLFRLNLFSLWAAVIVGIGLATLDSRSPKTTAGVLVGLLMAQALLFAFVF